MDALTKTNGTNGHDGAVLEAVIANGDLAKLTPTQRVDWYRIRCEAAGLDPRTQPFQYITLQGKLTLYATKTATEQLCARKGITTAIVGRDRADDLYIVTCRASADGRYTESIGAVSVAGLKGEALANALMKAETKAKRRAVLSLSGLGMLDETEVADIPAGAVRLDVDGETGEILEVAPVLTAADPGYWERQFERVASMDHVAKVDAAMQAKCPDCGSHPLVQAARERAVAELAVAAAVLGEVDVVDDGLLYGDDGTVVTHDGLDADDVRP